QERLYFDTAVTWQATLLYRLACVEQLRGFRPVIRGDKGWQTLLDRDFTLRPPLDYYRELPYFYNTCTVNFNATSLQMGTAVNQRLFDVPACGAFLLTDHQESLEELFVEGEEVITYRDAAEIPGLVRFYLAHPAARQMVVDRGRDRVLRQHTYRHRLQTLMETMEKRYA
ncbi:MAG: glycosyltransferase, partial [Desulfobacteraceae bacterium]|nr:glycosyltransferase [Desulfobacteraceae bacterium]